MHMTNGMKMVWASVFAERYNAQLLDLMGRLTKGPQETLEQFHRRCSKSASLIAVTATNTACRDLDEMVRETSNTMALDVIDS